MQWFYQLRVSVKLVLSFLLVAAVGAAVGGLGIFYMGRISASTESLYSHEMRALKVIQEANIHLLYASRAQMSLLSASTLGERKSDAVGIKSAVTDLETRMAEVKFLFDEDTEGKKLHQQYEGLIPPLKQHLTDFFPATQHTRSTHTGARAQGRVFVPSTTGVKGKGPTSSF